MKRRIHIVGATLLVAAGLTAAVAAPASAAPRTIKPLADMCSRQGGQLIPHSGGFHCNALPPGVGTFSDAQLKAARALCEGAFKGVFEVIAGEHTYSCDFPA